MDPSGSAIHTRAILAAYEDDLTLVLVDQEDPSCCQREGIEVLVEDFLEDIRPAGSECEQPEVILATDQVEVEAASSLVLWILVSSDSPILEGGIEAPFLPLQPDLASFALVPAVPVAPSLACHNHGSSP